MPKVSDFYFKAAILFLIVGIGMGILMSISGNHSAMGAHAHLNLVGWATSALFGAYFALAPAKATRPLAMIQFGTHMVGVVIMVTALYFLLQGATGLEMVVALGSIIVAVSVLMFAYMVFSR
ncbi:hypothetical protein NO932_04250 [Pelagibacterium sp. 26DY04]|uniref:hypothetical protein n=1 Tax=Pelagibacterium sp. 26DY04 TaxID=2967130 RepID=UPI0028153DBA|nr:hypothetical protein [Pelagibacterium sp. 26DY04]WMT87823.1 hypothetical protein NO932_04250 [Pelagibacterium sp. 26DY04]